MSLQTRFRIALTLALLTGLSWGCGSSDDGWETKEPAEAGFDQAALQQLTDDLRGGEYGNIHAVLIEHDGKLVYEEYFTADGFPIDHAEDATVEPISYDADTKHELGDISASVTSALLGAALRDAAFGPDYEGALDAPILDFLPEFEGIAGENVDTLTLCHALTMTTGLQWGGGFNTRGYSDNLRIRESADPVAYVLSRPVRNFFGVPGTEASPTVKFGYIPGLVEILAAVVQCLTGERIEEYARMSMFDTLGITDFEWTAPPAWRSHKVAAFDGLWMRPRDLAKIGSVFLHDGKWRGDQVLPAEWVNISTQDQISTDGVVFVVLGYGYGYHWWRGSVESRAGTSDVIAAPGFGGQRLFILPDERLVVTIFAGNYENPNFLNALSDELMERIVSMRAQ